MDNQLLQPLGDDSLATLPISKRSSTIGDKLSDLFGSTDFVRVINPDNEVYIWQYMPASKEHISFDSSSSSVPMKITQRESPEVYKLDPGQSAVLIGANAYLMIEGLVKRMIAKGAVSRRPTVKPGEARNFNFSDDSAQSTWISEIYLGKVTPSIAPAPVAPPVPKFEALNEPAADKIDEELGIANDFKPVRRRGQTVA